MNKQPLSLSLSNQNVIEQSLTHGLHQTNKEKRKIMKPQSNEQNSWEPTSAPRDSSLGKPRPQMQTPIRINRIVVGDYYHVTTMDESMSWMKLAHRQANFSLTLRPPFVHLPLLKRFLITFSNVHTKEEQDLSLALSLTYIMYADASNNTPFYTHVNLYVA